MSSILLFGKVNTASLSTKDRFLQKSSVLAWFFFSFIGWLFTYVESLRRDCGVFCLDSRFDLTRGVSFETVKTKD